MKCIGLIGGIGWESTALYYRLINEEIRQRFGSLHSARLVVNSLSFDPLDTFARNGQWNEAASLLADAARQLERAGAEVVILCSNQMHYVADQIQSAVEIPLLHIGAAIGQALGRTRDDVGLLGTRFTLEQGFLLEPRPDYPHWRKRRVHVPEPAERDRLDQIIYREICRGSIRPESKAELLNMAKRLRSKGARRVVLASSELALLLSPEEFPLWLDDSTELHAASAVRWALGEAKGPPDFSRASMPDLPGKPLIKRSKLVSAA
jgi:aspartate racemase